MVEPEVAFLEFDGLQELAEEFVEYVVAAGRRAAEGGPRDRSSATLRSSRTCGGRSRRITYREAIEILQKKGMTVKFGDDLGGDEETVLAEAFDRPVMVTRYPAAIKAFYMQPDPEDPDVALGMDMLAPRGTARSSAGRSASTTTTSCFRGSGSTSCPSRRSSGTSTCRKYGTFPHSGFGMGIERFVAWMSRRPAPARVHPVPADAEPDLSLIQRRSPFAVPRSRLGSISYRFPSADGASSVWPRRTKNGERRTLLQQL